MVDCHLQRDAGEWFQAKAEASYSTNRHEWCQSFHLTLSNRFKRCSAIFLTVHIMHPFPFSLGFSYLSGLNPSSSSRKMLLLVTVLSWLGMMRNLRMVPLLDPRNRTVRFRWGPASVSTTILFSWYLSSRTDQSTALRLIRDFSLQWQLKALWSSAWKRFMI